MHSQAVPSHAHNQSKSANSKALRIALILKLSPNKNGSLEQWMVYFAQEAVKRGHLLDIYTFSDIMPEIKQQIADAGARWYPIESVTIDKRQGRLKLSSYDLIHLNLFGIREQIPLLCFAAIPAKVLFVDHLSKSNLRKLPLVTRLLDRLSTIRIAGIAGVSNYIREYDLSRFKAPSKTRTIYNGVDTHRFRPIHSLKEDGIKIVCTAHLIPEKGCDHLLHAFSALNSSDTTLIIVGEGPERFNLENLAKTLNIVNKVRFVGLRNDVDQILQTADIFVHPALWAEAFGLGVAEAMSSGLAVIASDIGALPELIENEKSGLLVSSNDRAELSAALRRLVEDASLREELGRNARERVLERFSIDRSVKNHLSWCEEIGINGRTVSNEN